MPYPVTVGDPMACALEAQKRIFLKNLGPLALVGIPLVFTVVLFLFLTTPFTLVSYFALLLLLICVIVPPLAYLKARSLLKASFMSVPKGPVNYSFDEDGVSWQTTVSDSKVYWRGFTAFFRFKRVWVLIIARRQFITVPAESLSGELMALISSKVPLKN